MLSYLPLNLVMDGMDVGLINGIRTHTSKCVVLGGLSWLLNYKFVYRSSLQRGLGRNTRFPTLLY